MDILILGAGLMARGAIHDLLTHEQTAAIVVVDREQSALDAVVEFAGDPRVSGVQADLDDLDAIRPLMKAADGCLSAAHYRFNVELARLAIECTTHMVDLGGNNDIVRAQLALDEEARAAGVSIIPDCGLAPGMASMLVAWGLKHLPWADSVAIRVGGLPLHPHEPLMYERLFSVEGLINEYVEVPILMRDGKQVTAVPLDDIELLDFPEPVGTLEAFNTSGGVSTLCDSYAGRVSNLDYKTLRYPGHALAMRWLLELGLFSSDPVEVEGVQVVPRALTGQQIVRNVPLADRDRTVVRVTFQGTDGGESREHQLQIIDEFDEESGLTAMMRTTAFSAAIIVWMQCTGVVQTLGAQPQERALDPDQFTNELVQRGIPVTGLTAVTGGVGA